jgi:hypothetical protein
LQPVRWLWLRSCLELEVDQDAVARRNTLSPGKLAVPTAESEIRGEEHRTALVAAGDDLEEQIDLLAGSAGFSA